MKCISPVYVKSQRMHVPCGKCAFCINKKINAWCLRLRHELDVSSSALFITLTYNDDHLPPNGELSKRDLQLFIKRLRKVNPGIRYYAVGEYGSDNKRPHYHAIIYNLIDLNLVTDSWKDSSGAPIGFIVGYPAKPGNIRYMVKYMALPKNPTTQAQPFSLMSRRPGIGYSYVEKMRHWHKARSDSVVYDFSTPNAMPRYYKDKIFNVHERAVMHAKYMAFSERQNQVVCPVEHDKLWKQLLRKQ